MSYTKAGGKWLRSLGKRRNQRAGQDEDNQYLAEKGNNPLVKHKWAARAAEGSHVAAPEGVTKTDSTHGQEQLSLASIRYQTQATPAEPGAMRP